VGRQDKRAVRGPVRQPCACIDGADHRPLRQSVLGRSRSAPPRDARANPWPATSACSTCDSNRSTPRVSDAFVTLPCPERLEGSPVPADDRVRSDHHECVLPTVPPAGEHGPEKLLVFDRHLCLAVRFSTASYSARSLSPHVRFEPWAEDL